MAGRGSPTPAGSCAWSPTGCPQEVAVQPALASAPITSVHLARDGTRVVLVADGVLYLGVIQPDADGARDRIGAPDRHVRVRRPRRRLAQLGHARRPRAGPRPAASRSCGSGWARGEAQLLGVPAGPPGGGRRPGLGDPRGRARATCCSPTSACSGAPRALRARWPTRDERGGAVLVGAGRRGGAGPGGPAAVRRLRRAGPGLVPARARGRARAGTAARPRARCPAGRPASTPGRRGGRSWRSRTTQVRRLGRPLASLLAGAVARCAGRCAAPRAASRCGWSRCPRGAARSAAAGRTTRRSWPGGPPACCAGRGSRPTGARAWSTCAPAATRSG